MRPAPRRSLRSRIAAAERSELTTALDTDEEFHRVSDQSGPFFDPSEFLGAGEQVIIECHSRSHAYLHHQYSTTSTII